MLLPKGEGPEHFRLGPSSASRWLECPGSAIEWEEGDEAGAKAEAGTVAHDTSDDALKSDEDWLALVEDDILNRTVDMVGTEIAGEIAKASGIYIDYVRRQAEDLGGELLTEQKIAHDKIPDFGGTVDAVIRHKNGLTIIDLKTGTYKVPAKENKQLMCYSILARQEYPTKKPISATIIQPRVYAKPNKAVFTPKQLDAIEARVAEAATRTDRVAGNHCWFCPLRGDCQEYAERYGGGDGTA